MDSSFIVILAVGGSAEISRYHLSRWMVDRCGVPYFPTSCFPSLIDQNGVYNERRHGANWMDDSAQHPMETSDSTCTYCLVHRNGANIHV